MVHFGRRAQGATTWHPASCIVFFQKRYYLCSNKPTCIFRYDLLRELCCVVGHAPALDLAVYSIRERKEHQVMIGFPRLAAIRQKVPTAPLGDVAQAVRDELA